VLHKSAKSSALADKPRDGGGSEYYLQKTVLTGEEPLKCAVYTHGYMYPCTYTTYTSGSACKRRLKI